MRVARIFNTFGPRMHMNDGRVVSNFILQALQGENITVRDTVTDYIGVFIFPIFFWFFQPQPVLSGTNWLSCAAVKEFPLTLKSCHHK